MSRSHTALLIVDVEPRFLTPVTRLAIPRIVRLIQQGDYRLFVVAEYTDRQGRKRASSRSQWERTYGPLHWSERTVPELEAALADRPTMRVAKSTRSLFGPGTEFATALRRRRISTVHIVGLETHDCVLATAFDAFDHDFMTKVIPRACASKRRGDHRSACNILRRANLLIKAG